MGLATIIYFFYFILIRENWLNFINDQYFLEISRTSIPKKILSMSTIKWKGF